MQVMPITNFESDLADIIAGSRTPVLLLLSGGSLLDRVPRIVESLKQRQISFSKLTLSVVDERYSVDPNYQESNLYKLLHIPEFANLNHLGAKVIPIIQGRSLVATGEVAARTLDSYFDDDSILTIAIIGVGVDGHTMGVMCHDPAHSAIFHCETVVGYSSDEVKAVNSEFKHRVTLTFGGLKKLDKVMIYAVGEPKREILQSIVSQKQAASCAEVASTPALFLSSLPSAVLYTDLTLSST